MRRIVVLAALVIVAGCAKEKRSETKASGGSGTATATGPSAPTDAAVVAALPADCEPLEMGLLGAVGRATRGMHGKIDDGVAAWRAHRQDCRGGVWHLAAAILIRAGATTPLAVDGVSLERGDAAVARGLTLAPGDVDLLAYAAYLHGIEAGPLDPAACDRATAAPAPTGKAAVIREHGDRVAYVCGTVALEARDWAGAEARFAAIGDPPYADVGVRRVQAMAGAGRAAEARAAAKDAAAMIDRYATRPGVTDRDVETMRATLAAAVE